MVTKIFGVSISNDSIIRKEKKTHRAIEHSFRAEFIALLISVAESLVRFGHTLPGLGYMAHVTSSEMETAREVIDKHISSIATKCWLRFKMEALKKPHKQKPCFRPRCSSMGVDRMRAVDFDEARIDTLKDSLSDRRRRKSSWS